ncbi:MAG: hypothetical protein QXF26_10145 [Candidatus Bathyarchaeia archaeon]
MSPYGAGFRPTRLGVALQAQAYPLLPRRRNDAQGWVLEARVLAVYEPYKYGFPALWLSRTRSTLAAELLLSLGELRLREASCP